MTRKTLAIARHSQDTSWSWGYVAAAYTYDTAGRLATTSYPMTFTDSQGSWPALTTAYDSMRRPSTLTDSNSTQWVSSTQYDFAGRMTSLNYKTGDGSGAPTAASETMTYNAATGQLASLSWTAPGVSGGVQYGYAATQNNGQITQVTDTVSGESVVYQYDLLKRLTSAASTPNNGSTPAAWTEAFQYDGFGNLTAKVLNGTATSIPVSAGTNQLTNATYDLNGNMVSGVGATLTYDEANRMVTAQETSGGREYYGYGEGNKRVYRVTAAGQQQVVFYGAFGEKLGVYSVQESNCSYGPHSCISAFTPLSTSISFAGRLIMDSGNVWAQDRLGTNRASGARFYPYGDEITSTGNDRVKFGTYTRDSYTGLDYADQRFYASSYGRFNTPDPYTASGGPSDPGSWNRYSYVEGDPVNRLDPSGQFYCTGYLDGDMSCSASGPTIGSPTYSGCAADDFVQTSGPNDCYSMGSAGVWQFTETKAPPPPQCFAQLKDRPVNHPVASLVNAYHSFWWIEDSTGSFDIISGGPQNGYLNVWVVPGSYNGADNLNDNTVWSSGASAAACNQVDALESAARQFPNNSFRYSAWPGPNSNSAAHYLGDAAGFTITSVPDNLYGWNTGIPVSGRGPGKGSPIHGCPVGRRCGV